jgi:tetratricopeptide (TPR) repeat protein
MIIPTTPSRGSEKHASHGGVILEVIVVHKMQIRWVTIALMLIFSQASFAYAQEGYYVLGKEQLQFKLAAASFEEVKTPKDWEEMFDSDGMRYQVKKIPLIDSSDVEGIAVESFTHGSKEEYTLTIYFKKDSWDRIYDSTKGTLGKRIAVIRNNKLFSVPLVHDTIDASTGISGGINSTKLKIFIDGLMPAEAPDRSTRGKEYLSWLEHRQASNKNDLALASKLANLYLAGGTKDYARAAQLFETILQKDPSRSDNYSNLGVCYDALGKTDKAIEMYTKAISAQPHSEWAFRSYLADLYSRKGDKSKAIEEMNKSIVLLKNGAMPGSEGAIKSLERRLEEMQK